MILFNGPTSPFGRMARAVSLELALAVEEKVIDVYTAEFLDARNPLRQIPTLLLANGDAIYDSRVICAYFDSISGRPSLLPANDRWGIEVRTALAVGLMEAGLQRRMEIVRPEGEKSASVIAKLEQRMDRAVDRLESLSGKIAAGGIRMDQIATACALEYTDLRRGPDWRRRCPRLSEWLGQIAQRDCMVATQPR